MGKKQSPYLGKYKNMNMQICDYKSNRRFSLRCFSNDLILVSLKLKNNLRTHKSDCIIHRAERSLLNERIRNINNILERLDHDSYIYELKLLGIIGQDLMDECKGSTADHKETLHKKVLERQKTTFNRLWHKKQYSSSSSKNSKWPLIPGPLTSSQKQALGHKSVQQTLI